MTSPKEKSSKQEIKHLQEELMTVKVREAQALAESKETKQKVMELETQVSHNCWCECSQFQLIIRHSLEQSAQVKGIPLAIEKNIQHKGHGRSLSFYHLL